jgi:hypothetical protein
MQGMATAMVATSGATGLRAWLAAHRTTWLTPRRMRVVTVLLVVLGVLASSTQLGDA